MDTNPQKTGCGAAAASDASVLKLKSRIEEFIRLRSWLEGHAQRLNLPQKTAGQLLIAADEVFSNIARYAYGGEAGEVEAALEQDGPELKLIFADGGMPFDPLQATEPDTGAPLSERPVGGLGIFMVKKLMDRVEYRRENGSNILTLTKNIMAEVTPCR